jgi:hypothetical protein
MPRYATERFYSQKEAHLAPSSYIDQLRKDAQKEVLCAALGDLVNKGRTAIELCQVEEFDLARNAVAIMTDVRVAEVRVADWQHEPYVTVRPQGPPVRQYSLPAVQLGKMAQLRKWWLDTWRSTAPVKVERNDDLLCRLKREAKQRGEHIA